MKTNGHNKRYEEFLLRKRLTDAASGFEPKSALLPKKLLEFQMDAVKWGCRRGRAAFFESCGLGKTGQQLAWSQQSVEATGGNAIIFAPFGVVHQTQREGVKFGVEVNACKSQSDVKPGINITNYDRMHLFEVEKFKAVALDESSVLKAFDGATRNALIERCAMIPHRTAWTATPAPNDYVELGNHAEFLGVMSRVEMLATFFVHDGGDTSKWRLKGHAEEEFWRWMCSWSVSIRTPSDLGYDDTGFILPKLNVHEHVVKSDRKPDDGYLFALPASTLGERRDARRSSINERVKVAADLADDDQWIFWCNLNAESEALADALGAVEIRGETPEYERERALMGFLDGSVKRIVTKPSIFGFGLNLQCCHKAAFVGLSDSYEQLYQAIRRIWRFGQEKPVHIHIIISEHEGAVLANVQRKEADAERMSAEMVEHMADISAAESKGTHRQKIDYNPTVKMELPTWLLK